MYILNILILVQTPMTSPVNIDRLLTKASIV